ncbi:unnamed protein product (mitochondrion) [Plasmodiophora brassicae]|uniref:Adenylosuccinate synthetase n=1 Tax=Plasmodiophora brassicae TaxID=37360 RepID=A0A0G4J1G7_PLABS|nr:hypothetical protein PBRA_002094 [Plasmodiophora brassicae]SPQ93232.1 unnamed protein product [Plasmodiophora brassicae]
MPVTVVLGAQWGDEGKGKLVDILAPRFDAVARFNGGANAGHSIVVNGVKFALHLLPCGVLYPNTMNIIGNGTVVHVPSLMSELDMLKQHGIACGPDHLRISGRTHLLFDFHQVIDSLQETRRAANSDSIGTTKRGIGPCYSSKTTRDGLRMGDLLGEWDEFEARYRRLVKSAVSMYQIDYAAKAEEELGRYREYRKLLAPFIDDITVYLSQQLSSAKAILAEGANAALLDLDFGTYPFVTSSSTTAGGVCTGLGVPPKSIETIYGVVKAYTTRVGEGPFPTELKDANGEHLRNVGGEYGTTTGRPRRCGWLDIPLLNYSHILNGYDTVCITKLDVLCGLDEIKIGLKYLIDGVVLPKGRMPSTIAELAKVTVQYETLPGWKTSISSARKFADLPENAQRYVRRVEELISVPISTIGVGPSREDMVVVSQP